MRALLLQFLCLFHCTDSNISAITVSPYINFRHYRWEKIELNFHLCNSHLLLSSAYYLTTLFRSKSPFIHELTQLYRLHKLIRTKIIAWYFLFSYAPFICIYRNHSYVPFEKQTRIRKVNNIFINFPTLFYRVVQIKWWMKNICCSSIKFCPCVIRSRLPICFHTTGQNCDP